jgi:hypothetical protein
MAQSVQSESDLFLLRMLFEPVHVGRIVGSASVAMEPERPSSNEHEVDSFVEDLSRPLASGQLGGKLFAESSQALDQCGLQRESFEWALPGIQKSSDCVASGTSNVA